jgi:hypothetical protein
MTIEEYKQLRAFARNDGAFLGILWIVSFVLTMLSPKFQLLGTLGLTFAFLTPFFVVRRIRMFRDHIREGVLSYWNGYSYSMSMFFYAALLLALVQYLWFAFVDDGTFLATALDQMRQMLLANKYPEAEVNAAIGEMKAMRPIDWALYFFSTNVITGFVLSIVIALITKRKDNR